jgi:hypothetical protein
MQSQSSLKAYNYNHNTTAASPSNHSPRALSSPASASASASASATASGGYFPVDVLTAELLQEKLSGLQSYAELYRFVHSSAMDDEALVITVSCSY